MNSVDLLLVRDGKSLKAFGILDQPYLNTSLGEKGSFLGASIEYSGACCEWMEVTERETGDPIGIALIDFYQNPVHPSVLNLKADNVIWTEDGSAIFLLTPSKQWKIEPGPYLPVSFYSDTGNRAFYLIREGLSEKLFRDGAVPLAPVFT